MKINRSDIQITANPKRVIINFLDLGINTNNTRRVRRLINNILSIPENELKSLYEDIKKNFDFRHQNFEHYLRLNFKSICTLKASK